MGRGARETAAFVGVVFVIALAVATPSMVRTAKILEKKAGLPDTLRCAIEIGRHPESEGLIAGYNYYLLEKFADDHDIECRIKVSHRGDSYLDSLRSGCIDLLAIPFSDSLSVSSELVSDTVDSVSVWLMPAGNKRLLGRINRWLKVYHSSDSYLPTRAMFMNPYNPLRAARSGYKATRLSPYDEIIKNCADSIGWDWRLLAAVVHQESHFRIDAVSSKGALGLMQMMPETAERWKADDVMNPTQNIRAGSAYLGRLYRLFYSKGADNRERQKLTLAAYNAGEGRIKSVIERAGEKGIDSKKWDDMKSVIKEMKGFNGVETIAYVDQVMETYEAFKKICPE